MTKRILITGSRDWTDYQTIFDAIQEQQVNYEKDTVLISGNCPTGADHMAEKVAETLGIRIEYHPADWKQYGKRAGFIRNKEMVDLGATVCLAFIKNNSKGATMTAKLAAKAEIPMLVYREDDNTLF